jgi:hypothetical protein
LVAAEGPQTFGATAAGRVCLLADFLKPQPFNQSRTTKFKPKRRLKMKYLSKKSMAATIILLLTALSVTASAESLLSYATRKGNATGTTTAAVELDDSHNVSLLFKTTGPNKLVKITYNAECGVVGAVGSWLSVIIFIDGDLQANPQSNTMFALCTADGTDSPNWKGAARQSFITLPTAGTHNVHVQVDLNGGATSWWLGDSSIVVEQK